jgi:tetratricopeptide (TPR) repeat protein
MTKIKFLSFIAIAVFLFLSCSSLKHDDFVLSNFESGSADGLQVDNEFVKKIYEQAYDLASNGQYLRSSDILLQILAIDKKFFPAASLFEQIYSKMHALSVEERNLDIAKISYAKGFIDYYEKNYDAAVAQWSRYIQMKDYNEELQEYIYKITVMKMFNAGVVSFNRKQYTDCLKQMGKVEDFIISKRHFSGSLAYYDQAQIYIDRSIAALRANFSKLNTSEQTAAAQVLSSTVKQEDNKNNIEEANKKYDEGLLYYSQGDYLKASRTWELALRLNPNLEKAKVAIANLRRNRAVD